MAAVITDLNNENFEEEIKRGVWAVDFWAAWCMPCRMMAPHFHKAAEEENKIKFGKVDTQENIELAQEYDIRGIPCIIFFKNGKEVGRSVGLIDRDTILEKARATLL